MHAELDLRPFTKLQSVLGIVGAVQAGELGPLLRRMPKSLESLCLTAEGSELVHDFHAGAYVGVGVGVGGEGLGGGGVGVGGVIQCIVVLCVCGGVCRGEMGARLDA